MKLVHTVIATWKRLGALFTWRRRDRDLDDELAFHLAMRQAEFERAGAAPGDASRAARRQFGNVTSLKEETRAMWRFPSFDSLMQDIRYAVRSLIKTPGFSVVAVLVLAIGIGANTAMFSLVNAVLLGGLPYPDGNRLVVLIGNAQRATVERRGNSLADHLDWRAKATHFDDMAAFNSFTMTLLGIDEPERIMVEAVSVPYFSLLGASPVHGRTFHEEEDQVPNRDFVVVLSDGLWRRHFGADPSIVNRPIQLSGRAYTVVGIMPPGFAAVSDGAQLWIPFALAGYPKENRASRGFQTVARLKTGSTIEQAQAEMNVISAQLAAAYPASNDKRAVEISPLFVETFGQLQPFLLTLMAAVGFVLLIACTNVANLLIGRSEARQREIAVRAALGAGPARLFRQLVTESLVLTFAGAIAGLALAYAAVKGLVALSPVTLPSFVHPALNAPVLAFTIGVALASGVLLGLAPALHSRISRLADALKDSARGSGSVRSGRLRGALVVAEVAMAIVLFIGAGLMIRSGQKLAAVDPGFDPSGVLAVNVSIAPTVLSGSALLERVRAVPGVTSAALVSDVPLSGVESAVFYSAEGDATTNAQTAPRAYIHRVSASFFETLRLPLVHGRAFVDADSTPDSPSVIVSQNVVKRFWPAGDGLGKRIKLGGPASTNPWLTIVGVAGESKYRNLPTNSTNDPDLFFPALPRSPQSILMRASVDPARILPDVRAALRRDQPNLAVFGETTIEALVAAQTSVSRFTTWVLGLFASAALLLSVIGIYGVMSYLVAQRTREFGIRVALGASRGDIVRAVLGRGVMLIGLGVVIGVAATAGLYQLFSGLLYQVTAFDNAPALAILTLVGVAILACVVPAIRATRVDPVVALRS